MAHGPFRSLLFVPAVSPRKVAKALASAADGVILDLEDSVAVSEKQAAREGAAAALAGPRKLPVFVRINAMSTGLSDADLAAIAPFAPNGIIVPKVERADECDDLDKTLDRLESQHGAVPRSIEIMPIVETARGLVSVLAIAEATPRIRRLTFGAIDLALDMDIDLADESGPVAHARFAVALASRAAGLDRPFDSAFADFVDLEGLRRSALRARAFGFQGKGCIHPAQVEIVNTVFTPTKVELDRARAIVEAFEVAVADGAASVSVDGAMVDYPMAARARKTLAAARTNRT